MKEVAKRLREAAQWADKGIVITPSICIEAANTIETLQMYVDFYQNLTEKLEQINHIYRELAIKEQHK